MSEQQNITVSPPSDDRQRDVLAEKELNNSVRQPTPPPPQPEPISGSVARPNNAVTEEPQSQATTPPPLPNIFSYPQGGLNDDMMQAVRNVVTDTFKNITIDGVSPQISGSNIQFNTQNNQSASSQWAQQNNVQGATNSIQNNLQQPAPLIQSNQPQQLQLPQQQPQQTQQAQPQQQPQQTQPQQQQPQTSTIETQGSDGGQLTPKMDKPVTIQQAATNRQAEQEADNAKWGWNMTGPTSSKQAASERQAEQEAKDEYWGWSMTGPTDTKGKIQRDAAKQDAAEYDIDTRGMSTRQIKKAVAEAKEEDDAEQSEFDSRFERFVSSLKGKSEDKKEDKDDNKKDDNKGEKQRDKEEARNTTKESSVPRQKDTVEVLPVWLTSANQEKKRVAYVVAASNHDIAKGAPPDILEEDETELTFDDYEYYLCDGRPHPFKVTTTEKGTKYKVFVRSSITDGINGTAFEITGLNEDKSFEEGYVIAEATVTSNPFEISGAFEIKVVSSSEDAKEVKLEDGKQTKIRLFIAKLTGTSGGTGESAPKVWQAIYSSFRTAIVLHNGVPVYSLQAAPTHPDEI